MLLIRLLLKLRGILAQSWWLSWCLYPHDSPHLQLPFYRAQPAGTLPDATYCS
jgi:hypothetical protein